MRKFDMHASHNVIYSGTEGVINNYNFQNIAWMYAFPPIIWVIYVGQADDSFERLLVLTILVFFI
jgi:hypothetical protein